MSTDDVIDLVDARSVDPLESESPGKQDPKAKPRSSGALVPYRTNVPALLPPSLGDIDAYIRAANAAPVLTADEEHQLAVRLRDQNDLMAAQQLVLSHLRLVVSVARGYLGYGLAHADLIQEGNIGLMKAIKHYDPDKGVRLMSFAVHWIRAEIQDYVVRNWRLVKVATTKNQRKLFFNLRQLKATDKTLSLPQAKAIAQTLEVKPEEVLEMEKRMSGADLSMENPDEEDDDRSSAPIDYLASEDATPLQALEEKDTESRAKASLKKALGRLDARARRVIEARWLAEDASGEVSPMTLQELAAELGVSAERIRQIEKKALTQMREFMLESS